MTRTVEAKHIFLDIENYTYKRSVEAQSDIIGYLNQIVNDAVAEIVIDNEKIIFIPTGDGMCISLIDIFVPYDVHLLLAIEILKRIYEHNTTQIDEARRFNIRIGINENTDNLITDINGKNNISGSGINMASRIQGLADAGQILVGHSVYDRLVQREKYMDSFYKYQASVKHGFLLTVYQYKDESLNFINIQKPKAFIFTSTKKTFSKLTDLQANYLYLCYFYKDFIIQNIESYTSPFSFKIALIHFADNEVFKSARSTLNPNPTLKIDKSFEEYFAYLQKLEYWIIIDFARAIEREYLKEIGHFFEDDYLIVNTDGLSQLKKDFPDIYVKQQTIAN